MKVTELSTVSVPPQDVALGHHVAGIVDDIGVVAEAAVHRVGAAAAVEAVGARIADEDVGEEIAGAVDVAAAGQGEVLDRGGEREADRALDPVGALAGELGDDVAGLVDDVDVVAVAAVHHVGAERRRRAGWRRCCR